MKTPLILILSIFLSVISSTGYELERKTIADGEVSLLIPKEFSYASKAEYVPKVAGDPKPDDYFSNEDRSIEIGFMKIPKQKADLSWAKDFMTATFRGNETSFYFNDIITNGDTEIHLAEFDGVFEGKKQHSKTVIFNGKNSTIIGNISCYIELREDWNATAEEIVRSIQLTD